MTKTNNQSTTTRSSNRIKNIKNLGDGENSPGVSNQRASTKRLGRVVKTQSPKKNRMKLIHDFKRDKGKYMYFVEREGQNECTWELEDMIEDCDMVSQYLQKVHDEAGYIVESRLRTYQADYSTARSMRMSKARAIMTIKDTAILEENTDDKEDYRSYKQKSARSTNGSAKQSKKEPRKTKAQLQMEIQAEEREKRRKWRAKDDPKAIIGTLDHVKLKDCCLMCASSTFREALENDSMKEFKDSFSDYSIPYDTEHNPRLVEHALVLGKTDFAEYAKKQLESEKKSHRPSVPSKYKVYDSNTGSNRNLGYYNNQAYRQVQESRGNRLGNSAFYHSNDSHISSPSLNLENVLTGTIWEPLVPHFINPFFSDDKVLNGVFANCKCEPISLYLAINSGNRFLAGKMMDELAEMGLDHSFNHLHKEVLKLAPGKPLTKYKRVQVMKMASDAMNITPFHCAAIHPDASYLAEFYEQIDTAERLSVDKYNRSVAFYAAMSETTACLDFLIQKGFNLNVHDKYRLTPLIQAARFGKSHNVERLVKLYEDTNQEACEATFHSPLRNKRTALHYAAYFGHDKTCKTLIDLGAPIDVLETAEKQTPLHFAAKNGHYHCVKTLIEEGKANPEKGDKFSRNALHLACINGHINVVEYLLSYGVDANALDSSSNSSAHYAAAFGYLKILHLLIEYGNADPSWPNVWKSTPCSVANMKGHLGIVKYLINQSSKPIDVNFKDQNGFSLLQSVVNEAVETGSEMHSNIEKARLLLSINANPNSTDINDDTPLHTLASDNTFNRLCPLNWRYFYPNKKPLYRDYTSSPSTRESRLKKRSDIDGVEYQIMLAKLLIDHGADLNIKNLDGLTPLSVACSKNNNYLVALLIDAGSHFWIDTNNQGNNFFHYFGRLLARIDYIQPHSAAEKERFELYMKAVEKIWNSVESKLQPNFDYDIVINAYNNEGYTPLTYGIQQAIKLQKKSIQTEKLMIACATFSKEKPKDSQSHLDQWANSCAFEEHEGLIDVDLTLRFTVFLRYMEKFIELFHPNVNATIALPKDFKETNPSSYPKDTAKSALHLACEVQDIELILLLIKHKADVNQQAVINNKIITDPLLIAYHLKKDKKQEMISDSSRVLEFINKRFVLKKPTFKTNCHQVVKTLLKHNACPFTMNMDGVSPILNAASKLDIENLKLMCSVKPCKGYNINTKNKKNATALMLSVASIEHAYSENKVKGMKAIDILLSANADPNVTFGCGNTVLMRAIESSHATIVKIILNRSKVPFNYEHQNNQLENGLHIALRENNQKIISMYILKLMKDVPDSKHIANMLDAKLSTPLSYACQNGNIEATKQLFELSADPNIYDIKSVPLIEAVKSCNIDLVTLLLENGANIHATDENGNSPLHHAVLVEKHNIVDALIKKLADPNCKNTRKQTPLHLSIELVKNQRNRSLKVERILMKNGADLNALDIFGRTPLHYAFVDCNTIPLTRNTSVIQKKVKQICKEMESAKARNQELQRYINRFKLEDKDSISKDINTWLVEAKTLAIDRQSAKESAKAIASKNDDIIDDNERSILEPYVRCEFENVSNVPARSDPIEIIKFASEFKNVNFDVSDEFGRTPLHYAACVGAFSCTFILVDKGVDVNALDIDKNGPIQLALRNNHVDYSVMLCNFGAILNRDISLKDGQVASTFSFSLSKSLINIAYIIMDKDVLLIRSIHDALQNGKFHMAEMLLQSAEDHKLCQVLKDEQQNLWHVIANFKPFDSEIWHDYLEDVISKASSLNLEIHPDTYGRTPLHYAAKHGQDLLLKHLISIAGELLDNVDEEGNTVLHFAVASGSLKCVKMVLEKGVAMNRTTEKRQKSPLLQSVENSQYEIAKLLLENGASPDDKDSFFGWSNAVMIACYKKDSEMLKLLIDHGADLNTPSYIERIDKNGQPIKVLIHPIFIASAGQLMLKMLLEGGANPNVFGPDVSPENGQSCFTYNIAIKSLANQKLLLDHNIDLNIVEKNTSRTLFYQQFFGREEPIENGYCFHSAIRDQMLRYPDVQVSHVDAITGATPLEYAIYQEDLAAIESLLTLGADVNVESFDNTKKLILMHMSNSMKLRIPVILHAVLVNRLEILDLVCKKSKKAINWMWQDAQGNNMLSYILGTLGNYSFVCSSVKKYFFEKMGQQTFKELLQMKDHRGKKLLMKVHKIKERVLDDFLLTWYPNPSELQLDQDEIFDPNNPTDSMEIDGGFVSIERVEEDARAERVHLQELEKTKQEKSEKESKVKDERFEIDEYSKLDKVGEICLDEDKMPYNISLLKFDYQQWYSSRTSFYKLSIIYNRILDVYVLWTRWGTFGFEGQHQKTPFLTKEEAVSEFEAIFKSKTGNQWSVHTEDFVPKLGKYDLIKKAPHPKDEIVKSFDFLESNKIADLPAQVLDLMKLICNFDYLSKVYSNTEIDMPLGQIPQKSIEEARRLLKEMISLTKKHEEAKKCFNDKSKIRETKEYQFKISQNLINYRRLLPRYNETNVSVIQTYPSQKEVPLELAKLEDLDYVGFAANVILAAKHNMEQMHPLEYAYRTLACTLQPIPLTSDTPEYLMILNYIGPDSQKEHDILHAFSVNRGTEQDSFEPFKTEQDRKLLWHGSRIGNIMGILKQGLRPSPRTSGSNGSLFGNGIYFADTFQKSLGYAHDTYGDSSSSYKVMLLCEVALGENQGLSSDPNYQEDASYDSVKGEGLNIPNPDNALYDEHGLCIPCGPRIPYKPASALEDSNNRFNLYSLNFNEYIVYNPDRVKIRYLLVIKDGSVCHCCHKSSDKSPLKTLACHNLSDFKYTYFNKYEAEVCQAYMVHFNKTIRDVYNEGLDEFIEQKAFGLKWKNPLDLSKKDKVCSKCAIHIASVILENKILSNVDQIEVLDKQNQREQCQHGKKCTRQQEILHAQRYKHWHLDPKDTREMNEIDDMDIDTTENNAESA